MAKNEWGMQSDKVASDGEATKKKTPLVGKSPNKKSALSRGNMVGKTVFKKKSFVKEKAKKKNSTSNVKKKEDFVLKIDSITKIYKKKKVVNSVSFEVKQGEVVGLLGPNGAGKTTCFYITVGLVKPEIGRVLCNDKVITHLPMYKRAKLGIGYLPQEASVFRKMTVENNIMSILETTGITKVEQEERCSELMRRFKIVRIANQLGYTLSGGERRRVEIARALAANPKILLLDEPFAGVDPIAIQDIQSVITDVQKLGIGVLITDHNVRETLKIVSRAYVIANGSILIKGTTNQLAKSRIAKKSYLGEDFTL